MSQVEEYIENNECEVHATGEEARRIIKLEIRDTAKKVIVRGLGQRYCPSCGCSGADYKFCDKCGQRIVR